MSHEALDRVFDQIGHCGIWCGSCAVGTGALSELAERYCELCESHGLGEWGADGFDYGAFLHGLVSIASLPGCPGCRRGGGRKDCELRACSTERGSEGCVACGEFGACLHDGLLLHMRRGAEDAGLVVLDGSDEQPLSEDRRRQELERIWWWRALYGRTP
jgi:hypothetical protein